MTKHKIAALSQRLAKLANDYKATRAALITEARRADIEPAALGRLVTWMRKDELARLEQEAVDDQYRFLAGLRPAPAKLPTEGELAAAAALYAEKLTIRAVADRMGISVGKAHQLKMKASAFNVHAQMNMNTAPETALQPVEPDGDEDDARTEASKPAAGPGSDEDNSRAQASKLAADDLPIPAFLDRTAKRGHSATDPPNT